MGVEPGSGSEEDLELSAGNERDVRRETYEIVGELTPEFLHEHRNGVLTLAEESVVVWVLADVDGEEDEHPGYKPSVPIR
jgi:hypothetical protein